MTPIAIRTNGETIKGQPQRFCKGHKPLIDGFGPNPSGLCMCGCGEPAPIAKTGNRQRGEVKGKPKRYIRGHGVKKLTTPMYVIDEATGCWVWQRSMNSTGYGRMNVGSQRNRLAHRVFYERLVGPIPEGLQLDHLCFNRACVNPDHLEPVTNQENMLRAMAAKRLRSG